MSKINILTNKTFNPEILVKEEEPITNKNNNSKYYGYGRDNIYIGFKTEDMTLRLGKGNFNSQLIVEPNLFDEITKKIDGYDKFLETKKKHTGIDFIKSNCSQYIKICDNDKEKSSVILSKILKDLEIEELPENVSITAEKMVIKVRSITFKKDYNLDYLSLNFDLCALVNPKIVEGKKVYKEPTHDELVNALDDLEL